VFPEYVHACPTAKCPCLESGKVTWSSFPWANGVVPFAVELVRFEIYSFKLFVTDCNPFGVVPLSRRHEP